MMRVGGRQVIQTGSIVTQPGDTSFEIGLDVSADLSFRFLLQQDDSKATSLRAEGEGTTLRFFLTNFDNTLGTSWSSQVGTLGNAPLFLALYVTAIGLGPSEGPVRLINFTFSIEPA